MKINNSVASTIEDERQALIKEIQGMIPKAFTEREKRLLNNCITYAAHDPAGMPGHNLAILAFKLFAHLIDFMVALDPFTTQDFEAWLRENEGASSISHEDVEFARKVIGKLNL